MSVDRADLTGPHDLVLVEQEHRHACRVDQLLHLRSPGAERGPRVAVRGGLADAVRLVEDQHIDDRCARRRELVEVLEHASDRGFRAPATCRRVWVNALDPVACRTVRPCRDSSPISDSAITLFPDPGRR